MKQKHILFGLLALLCASCADHELEERYTYDDRVQVTAGIGNSRVGFNEVDSVTYAFWQDQDVITLSTSTQGNLNYVANLSEDEAGTVTFSPEDSYLKDIDGETVYACYPSAAITEEKVALLSTKEWTDAKPLPFAYATGTIGESKVNLHFKHIFSFLKLTVGPDILADSTKAVKCVTVSTTSDVPLSVGEDDTFDFSTLTASTTNGSDTVRVNMTTHTAGSTCTVYIPVLPQPANAKITVTLTDDNGEVLYTQTKDTPSSGFLVGNVYRVGTSYDVAYLLDGTTFNARIKQLANGNAESRAATPEDSVMRNTMDSLIAKINFETEVFTLPKEYVTLSADNSPAPVYASFDSADSLLTVFTSAKTMEIEDASYLFNKLKSLRAINFGNFRINETTTNMLAMFYECSALVSLDVSGWDISNVTSMEWMFSKCSSLVSLDVSNWNTSNVTHMAWMFSGCSSLATLDVSGWDTSNVTSMSYMFNHCDSLASLDVSGWDTSNVTNMSEMFGYCSSLSSLDVSKWNTANVTDMSFMFCMFGTSPSLTSLDVSGWDTSKVTDMGGMFGNCSSLTSLDVSGWDTSKVTDMKEMFYGCELLTALDVANWNTSNVTTMFRMFRGCYALTTLDISDWDTSKVTDMSYMFGWCHALTSLDASKWDVSNVTDMNNIFIQCTSMTSLNLSGWDISSLGNMTELFRDCYGLTKLNISNWTLNEKLDYTEMFMNCAMVSNICEITATLPTQEYLLSIAETTGMNTAWFVWINGGVNTGSSVENMPNQGW